MTTIQIVLVTVCAVIDVCAAWTLGNYLGEKLVQHSAKKRVNRRAAEDVAFLQNEYYNAASDILRESARHRFNSGNRH
jgi:hypothetical protein